MTALSPRKLSGLGLGDMSPSRKAATCRRSPNGRGMTLFRNASDFIPLTMIPLTELAVGNAAGHADLSRRNQMKADDAGKTGKRFASLCLCVKISFDGCDNQSCCDSLARLQVWRHG